MPYSALMEALGAAERIEAERRMLYIQDMVIAHALGMPGREALAAYRRLEREVMGPPPPANLDMLRAAGVEVEIADGGDG